MIVRSKISKILMILFNKVENNENAIFFKNGEYNFAKFIISNNKKIIFFDVGANIGNYSEFISKLSLDRGVKIKGYLFEPIYSCFKIIENNINLKDFKKNNLAVSNKKGNFDFFINDVSEQSSFNRIGKDGKKLKVKTITLFDYITKNNIKKINFLKVDCEGHDLFVLQGLKNYLNNNFVDLIQFEYGGCNIDSNTYLRDFYDLFKNKGFIICKIMPNYVEIREYSHYMENFHYANYVAVSKNFIEKNVWMKKYVRGKIL